MANLTVYQGRRCTRVRRAVNGTIATSPTPKAAGSTSSNTAGAVVTTSLKGTSVSTASPLISSSPSVFAPTTNFPNQSGGNQIATVVIPNIASLGIGESSFIPQITPLPIPIPQQVTSVAAPGPIASSAPIPPQGSIPIAPIPPPTGQTTAVPKAPNSPPPSPQPAPQNPPTNQPQFPPPPPQQQPNNPQPLSPQPQPNNPASSSRPQTQPSQGQQPQPPNPAPNNPDSPAAGRGGGSGAAGPELSQGQPQPSGQQAQPAPPAQQSSIPGQLVPPLSQAQGSDVKTSSLFRGPIPVLVTVTSNGVARTTLITPTGSARGRSTDLGRLQPTQSQIGGPLSSGSAGIGAGTQSGLAGRPTKGNSTAIIAGVVSAFVVIGVICAIIFIRARKKKQTPRDVVVSSHYSDRSNSVRNVRTFFSTRFSRGPSGEEGSQRTNTPALESGMDRTPYMTEIEPSRRRSSSEPASRSMQSSPVLSRQSKMSGAPTLVTPMLPETSQHRRSVSSLSGMAYPVLTNTNNPFMDPNPDAPLRIVNPDLSRSGSISSNPQTPGKRAMTPTSLGAAVAGAGAMGAIAAAKLSPSPLKQATSSSPPNRSMQQVSQSMLQDPFSDPETIMEDPFADPIGPPVVAAARNSRMNHQRNKSSLASSASQYSDNSPELNGEAHQRLMAGVPLITKTAPSSIASSHRHNGSGDSGFVSNNNSPALAQSARFNGLGISNVMHRSSRSITRAPLLPTSTPRDPSLLQPTSVIAPPPIPLADRRISHNRLSSTSSASDLSLSFPSSWGSPGPTRPASIATQGGNSLAAALAAANSNSTVQRPRDSRASDPFDLDDPTLFSYAASDAGGYNITTLSRENSGRSINGASQKQSDTLPTGRRP